MALAAHRPLSTTSPAEEAPPKPSIFERRIVRVVTGAVLAVTCLVLAVASAFLPVLEYRVGTRVFSLSPLVQSGYLALVPVCAGSIGLVLGAIFAATRSGLRWSFFVIGGVALLFSIMILIDAEQSRRIASVIDPALFDKVKFAARTHVSVGNGVYTGIVSSILVIGFAFAAWRAQIPIPEDEKAARLKQSRRIS